MVAVEAPLGGVSSAHRIGAHPAVPPSPQSAAAHHWQRRRLCGTAWCVEGRDGGMGRERVASPRTFPRGTRGRGVVRYVWDGRPRPPAPRTSPPPPMSLRLPGLRAAVLAAALVAALAAPPAAVSQPSTPTPPPRPAAILGDTARYAAAFDRIDAARNDGKPRTALAIADSILAEATRRGDGLARVRATLTSAALVIETGPQDSNDESDALAVAFDRLRAEAASATGVLRPVLQSHLATTYAAYLRQSFWQISQRTATASGPRSTDVTTWTARDLADAAIAAHRAALAAADGPTGAAPLADIAYLLDGSTAFRSLRPTVLDLVGNAALDFLTDGFLTSSFPAERFRLTSEAWFGDPEAFSAATLAAPADTSFEGETARLFQRLTRAHLAPADAAPLLDLTLRRLAFARANATLADRDARTEAAYRRLLDRYAGTPHVTAVAAALAQMLSESGGTRVVVPRRRVEPAGEITPEALARRREALSVCETAQRFPDTPGAVQCRRIAASLKSPSLAVEAESVVAPGLPMRALVTYANVGEVYARVVRVPDGWRERYERAEWRLRPAIVAELYRMAPVQSVRTALPEAALRTRRAEIALDGIAAGHVAILLSADGRFTPPVSPDDDAPLALVQATILAALTRSDGRGGLDVQVVERQSGAALAGVTVRLLRQEYRNRGTRDIEADRATTTADGTARLSASERYGYVLELTKGGDTFRTDGVGLGRDGEREDDLRATLFTDRAVYRPGQPVHVKAVLMTTDGRRTRVEAGRALRLTFVDANGTDVASETLTTNEFGSVAAQFTAPQGVLTGGMQIVARVGEDVVGSASVQVEEYRRPRFEVTFEPLAGTPVLGQAVTATGLAASYAGVPLGGAQVAYRVVRRPFWPWWWGGWRGNGGGEEQVAFGTATAGADGRFDIAFTPEPDPGDDPASPVAYRYEVSADVTDASGETQSGKTTVTVGFARLRAAAVLPPILDRADAGADTLRIVTENLDGTPVDVRGTVTIERLAPPERALRARLWQRPDAFTMPRATYERLFPNDIYDNEDDRSTWPTVGAARVLPFDTGVRRTLRLPGLATWEEGVYRVTTRTTDADGRAVETAQTVTITDRRTRAMPHPALVWSAMTDGTARVGETATVLVGSSERGVRVRVEIEVDGRIVRTETLVLSGEKRRIDVPITEQMRGESVGVHVSAWRANRPFTTTHTVSVASGRDLKLAFETFRSRLLPGADETWTLRVSGEGGERVAAEVAAAMYDASLDAIAPHDWAWGLYGGSWLRRGWGGSGPGTASANVRFASPGIDGDGVAYESLDRFGLFEANRFGRYYARAPMATAARATGGAVQEEYAMAMADGAANEVVVAQACAPPPPPPPGVAGKVEGDDAAAREALGGVQARRNLSETAFFLPTLRPGADGTVALTFTVPEALTRWRILATAHTADLRTAMLRGDAVTQKDLIVTPNIPRVLREGDRVRISARLDNRAGRALAGEAMLTLLDAATMQPVDAAYGNGRNVAALRHRRRFERRARLGDRRPGRRRDARPARRPHRRPRPRRPGDAAAPPRPPTCPMARKSPCRCSPTASSSPRRSRSRCAPGRRASFTFEELLASATRSDVQHHKLTLEITANPAWLAVLALPSLADETGESTDATFARLYAGLIATHIAASRPAHPRHVRGVAPRGRREPDLAARAQRGTQGHRPRRDAVGAAGRRRDRAPRPHRHALRPQPHRRPHRPRPRAPRSGAARGRRVAVVRRRPRRPLHHAGHRGRHRTDAAPRRRQRDRHHGRRCKRRRVAPPRPHGRPRPRVDDRTARPRSRPPPPRQGRPRTRRAVGGAGPRALRPLVLPRRTRGRGRRRDRGDRVLPAPRGDLVAGVQPAPSGAPRARPPPRRGGPGGGEGFRPRHRHVGTGDRPALGRTRLVLAGAARLVVVRVRRRAVRR